MKKDINLIVDKEMFLLDFLLEKTDFNRKKIKSLLHYETITIDKKIITQFNYKLKNNQTVKINLNKNNNILSDKNIDIIYEDNEIIVINKPNGLLSIDDYSNAPTAYRLVSDYVKTTNKNNRIFIVHRLDRDTSGVLLFAKNERIKKLLQDNWDDIVIGRHYYAVVNGAFENKSGEVVSFLKEDKNFFVYSTNDKDGKKAITKYKVIKENKLYSLLDIKIKTGRKNQIRVHMKDINHPILGDKKYGINDKKIKRLGLHAYKLELTYPINNQIMCFESKCPKELINIFKNK